VAHPNVAGIRRSLTATIYTSLKYIGCYLFLALIQNILNTIQFFPEIPGCLNQFLVRTPYTLHVFYRALLFPWRLIVAAIP
jgi:hypothetical protein